MDMLVQFLPIVALVRSFSIARELRQVTDVLNATQRRVGVLTNKLDALEARCVAPPVEQPIQTAPPTPAAVVQEPPRTSPVIASPPAAVTTPAFTLHVAQGVLEHLEMVKRHGTTPIRHAKDIGILGPTTVIGHAILPDTHSWIRWHTKDDIRLLAESGCSVAHCPTPFARYGQTMENFGDYLRAGVTMGLGTDCAPHNLVEEMRKAAVLARIAARDIKTVTTADLFHAATAGGATALMRDDIGRLAPGKKADIVLVDLACPQMQPDRDPLKLFAEKLIAQKLTDAPSLMKLEDEVRAEMKAAVDFAIAAPYPNADKVEQDVYA